MKLSNVMMSAVLVASLVGGVVVPTTSTFAKKDDHKFTLCHATNSATNPYVSITVDYHAFTKQGHDGHNGGVATSTAHAAELKAKKERWGDIIPATAKYGYAGQNLTSEGLAILNNDCTVPSGTGTGTTPTTPATPGTPTNPVNPNTPTNPDKDKPAKKGKVTICHATNAANNPYRVITVSENSIVNPVGAGHDGHDGGVASSYDVAADMKSDKQRWGDIIPALPEHNYAGQNWDAKGQAVYNNDCKLAANTPVVESDEDVVETPVTDEEVTPAPETAVSDVVVLDDAAFTDEPRVATLPQTGSALAPLAIVAVGMIAAGITYLSSYFRRSNDLS